MGIDERIEESKNWFERLAEHIPGYKGYKEKELRREADKIQRLYVAERLETGPARLDDAQARPDSTGATWTSSGVHRRRPRASCAPSRDRIQFADYGYAGLFDTDKVDEDDARPALPVRQCNCRTEAGGIEELGGGPDRRQPLAARPTSTCWTSKIEALDAHFAEREHLITGAGR